MLICLNLRKKNEQAPILNQKTMDSLSSTFRRHNVARKITSQPPTNKRKPASKKPLQAFDSITSILDSIQREGNLIKDGQMPSTSSSPPQSAKKGTKNSANKKGGVQIKEEPMDEESMDASETASPASSKRSGAKRKLDETDLKSIQASTNMRSRFTNNEYDMLVLIRSISYFLNPIHRFWLNPSVMRDIMHMYVPESRSKTVSSLLAASAREMLRPGRTNQLQYIVKTFTDDKKMIKIRDELAVQCKNDEEKSGVFWQAFTTAHKLIFLENEGTPDASVNDREFQKYLTKKKISICPAEVSPIAGFPRRSRKPQNLEDVQHFVAYNVVMSTLITEACRVSGIEDGNSENPTSFRSDFLINSISPASLTETLEICRSDGLISRVRNTEAKAYLTKNQVTISIYFRHFFNHIYRKDLVDLLKEILLDPPQEGYNPTDDDNPAALIHMLDFVQHNQQYQINLAHLTELIDINVKPTFDENGKEVKSATKNMRQLETAPMRLDRITINFPQKIQNAIVVPQREDVAQIICPVYSNTTFEDSISMQNELRAQLKKHPSLSKKVSVDDALRVLGFITLSEFNGTTFSDLKENTNMNDTNLSQVLELFAKLSIAFPCGIDVKRYVSAENSQAWLIKTDTSRFAPRPWTLPNGLVNWPILRWMSEAMLTTILLKSGIKIEELNNLFACVLSPILVRELIDFLATIGCCLLKEEHFASQKVLSPFESDQRGTETYLYVTPVLDALKKFAVFFADTPMPESLLHREKV
ncbi:General transcription factor 3C polypeptide 1 [Aphelenchoides bicaudatus]|nr:General transcription factor 3C polypeptide 1 [Aphelenchoides bicaudatus]